MAERPDRRHGERASSRQASSPAFTSLASAFGMAIAELALALGTEEDVEVALEYAGVVAQATYIAESGRKS